MRDSFAKPTPEAKPRQRTGSIATDGLQPERGNRASFRLLLSCQPSQFFFRFLDVLQRQLARLHHVRHYRLAAEEAEQFIDQPTPRAVPRNRSLEDIRFADSFRATKRLLRFETIDHRLDRR